MATTTTKKPKVSFLTVFNLILRILPQIIEAINEGRNASIDLSIDSRGRLNAAHSEDGKRPIKSVSTTAK